MPESENLQIRFDPSWRCTIAGIPGSGKTTLMKYLAFGFRSMPGTEVDIYDPQDQYRMFTNKERYVPPDDEVATFDRWCADKNGRKNVVALVEEAHNYMPQGRPLAPNAHVMVNRSRNWGVGVYAITTRPQELSKTFYDLCRCQIFFNCGLTTRQYLPPIVGKEIANRVAALGRFEFMYLDLTRQQWIVRMLDLSERRQRLEQELAAQRATAAGGRSSMAVPLMMGGKGG